MALKNKEFSQKVSQLIGRVDGRLLQDLHDCYAMAK
jgi:hypothetical protein